MKEKGESIRSHSNSIWSIHSDSTNRIWLGFTIKVLSSLTLFILSLNFYKIILQDETQPFPISVSSIIKDNNDRLWFSSVDNGVYVYDSFQNEYTHLNDPKNKIANGLNSLDITSLFIDSQQNIWIASWYNGLYFLRNGTKNFININTDSTPHKLISNRVVSFSEDTSKVIWIGTFEGGLFI